MYFNYTESVGNWQKRKKEISMKYDTAPLSKDKNRHVFK